ncbi:MAG: beta-propeller fold lactonase family protein [Lachnospiraceae bacterium]|nr:beta-propeller fold lactonase family protein [Lachnospiraceae bacterium]
MAKKEAYVAYVGTYTNGGSHGIHIYDVDVEKGELFLRRVVPLKNSTFLTLSRNGKILYSLADEGVEAFEIQPDGEILPINMVDMDGMRGHQMTHDRTGKYLFVGGYHDGKISMIETLPDGTLGDQLDGVYHKGEGSVGERSWMPHICCVRMTPDNKFLCAADSALNRVSIYRINPNTEKLQQVDNLRMGREVGPRVLHFSEDGRFAYLLCEISCCVRLYAYSIGEDGYPHFDYIEEYSTLSENHDVYDAAVSMNLSYDGNYLICSTAGDNSVTIFKVDKASGKLSRILALPIAGRFPKATCLFPDQKHLAVLNNASNTITTFAVDYEKGTIVMNARPQTIHNPNCMIFNKIEKAPEVFRNVSDEEAEKEAAAIMEIRKKKRSISLKQRY